MFVFLLFLGVIIGIIEVALIYNTIESGRLVIYGTTVYFCEYSIISGLLIQLNRFSLMKACLGTVIASAVICMVCIAVSLIRTKIRKSKFCRPVIKGEPAKWIPLFIIMLAFGVLGSFNKSGFYALSQDQGFYQARAMFYLGDNYDNNIEFSEIENIAGEDAAEYYRTKVEEAQGGVFVEGDTLTYQLRGLGTFPAQLALFGKAFGASNMSILLTVFYILTIGVTFIVCDNMGAKRSICYLFAILEGLCPMIVWSAKNTLCEAFLMLLIGTFLSMLFEDNKDKGAGADIITVLPVAAFCFYHLSVTMFIPIVVTAFLTAAVYKQKKIYIADSVILVFVYVLGQKMMSDTSFRYWYVNLDRIFSLTKRVINENNFLTVIMWISVVYAILAGILALFLKKIQPKKEGRIGKIILILLSALFAAVSLLLFYKSRGKLLQGQELDCLTMFGVLILTEFIVVPAAFIGHIILAGEYVKNYKYMITWLMFYYIIIVMFTGVYSSMKYYFYYGRYLTPFLLVMYLGALPLFDRIKVWITIPVMAVLAGVVVYEGRIVYTEKDVTLCDYDVVFDMCESIEDEETTAVIIIDNNLILNRLLMPIKGLTEADVYFGDSADLCLEQNEIGEIITMYDNIYMLVYDEWFPVETTDRWENVYTRSMVFTSYDRNNGLPFPESVTVLSRDIGLFKYSN